MRYFIGLLAILLCLGQSCTGLNPNPGPGTDDDGDGTDNPPATQPAPQTKGVLEGIYTGHRTTVYTLDNLSDAYPAQTQTSGGIISLTFGSDGLLHRADGSAVALGDIEYSGTPYGTLAEQVTAITLGTRLTEYRTQTQLVMAGAGGLSWTFTGSGLHTYRLTGGEVLATTQIEMVSNVAGGASYRLTIESSATLAD